LATGKTLWERPIHGAGTTPLLLNDRLLVPSRDGTLYVFSVTTGSELGRYRSPEPLRIPALAIRQGIVVCWGRQVTLLASGSLEEQWMAQAPDSVRMSPLVAPSGIVYGAGTWVGRIPHE
jgi:outer membrane protein assembly factor BamB